jgi:hypothetical protein
MECCIEYTILKYPILQHSTLLNRAGIGSHSVVCML